jgi:hypothetical protein
VVQRSVSLTRGVMRGMARSSNNVENGHMLAAVYMSLICHIAMPVKGREALQKVHAVSALSLRSFLV